MTEVPTPPSILALHSLEHYIQSLLADPYYDPPVSTITHLNKLLSICKEGLEGKTLSVVESSSRQKVVVSISAMTNHRQERYASGIIIRSQGIEIYSTTRDGYLSTTSPRIRSQEIYYDAAWDALSFLSNFKESDIQIRAAVLWDPLCLSQAKREAIQHVIDSMTKINNDTIEFVPALANDSADLKKASSLVNAALGLNIE